MLYRSILISTFSALALATAIPHPNQSRDISIERFGGILGNNRDNGRDNDRQDDNDDDSDDKDNGDVSENLVIALFNGINANIIIQQTEQNAVLALINFMSSPDRDNRDVYDEMRNTLVIIIDAGVNVRESNERMAEKVGISSDARDGLKLVADAQDQEAGLIDAMTGDADNDLPILEKLLDAFEGDAKQNLRNQQMVSPSLPWVV